MAHNGRDSCVHDLGVDSFSGFSSRHRCDWLHGGKRKRWHRINGYIASFLAFLITVEAVVLQMHKEVSMRYIAIFLNAFMIIANLTIGVYYARAKQFACHKSAMAWTCAWTAAPGMVRIMAYLLIWVSGGCNVETLGFFVWGAASIMFACVYPTAALLKEVKTKLFLGNVCGILLALFGDVAGDVRLILSGGWCAYH